jgi:hypothetical protein
MKFQRCISPAATREQVSPDSLRRVAKGFGISFRFYYFYEENIKITGFAATIFALFV